MTERFGRYEVHELLGRGSSGEVHRAVDVRLARDVALKRLPADLVDGAEFRDRFHREVAAAAAVANPHMPPILDHGEIDCRFYVATALVPDATNLARHLGDAGRMPVDRAVAVLEHVADALDAAHDTGLVHGDVKPSNIVLEGRPGSGHVAHLVDFGIAVSLQATGVRPTTGFAGTPHYMPPERFAGDGGGDRRGDVYSLGCVLHEMLTGRPPFEAQSLPHLMFQHLHQPAPAPSATCPELPPGLDAVVARALAKELPDRFADAGALAAAARVALPEPVVDPTGAADDTRRAPPPRETKGLVYGIDLGTTYSCIGLARSDGPAEVFELIDGSTTLPSVVLFVGADDYVTGERARVRARAQPDDVCSLVKRRMGDGEWRFVSHGRRWSAPAVSGLILKALVSEAEFVTRRPVGDVVITVPAYFGDEERRSTKLAGEYAGLRVLDVINEPTAAALSYGFARLGGPLPSGADEEVALVYDLGGGTVDVTVVELAQRRLSVVAIDGDHELGGADWDEKLAVHLSRAFCAQHPEAEDPLDDGPGTQALILLAERTKRRLTEDVSVVASVEHDGVTAAVTVTRTEFERLTSGLLQRTLELAASVVEAARARGARRPDRVLLVGGSSRMPAVGRQLEELLGVPIQSHDPDLAVARGAAIYGRKKAVERLLLADLVSRGQLVDDAPLVLAAPADVDAACARLARSYGMPPAEVRRTAEIQVVNVCPRGLGVLALDRHQELVATYLVHRNDRLPLAMHQFFGTIRDDQDIVTIRVIEQVGSAESARPEDGKIIAEASIIDIPSGFPAGSQVEVTLAMGFDGILAITAVHEAVPDRPLTLRVETSAALSRADVAREREQVARARYRDA